MTCLARRISDGRMLHLLKGVAEGAGGRAGRAGSADEWREEGDSGNPAGRRGDSSHAIANFVWDRAVPYQRRLYQKIDEN
jgi:hypothetical protein